VDSLSPAVLIRCQELAQLQQVSLENILQAGWLALALRYEGRQGDAPEWTFRRLLTNPPGEAKTVVGNQAKAQEHYERLLAALVAEPDKPISEPCFLSVSEREKVLVTWNDTRTQYPRDRSIAELFEEVAGKCPDRVAVIDRDDRFTYGMLGARASQLAAQLELQGVVCGSRVGLALTARQRW